jgi:hypothetical protein
MGRSPEGVAMGVSGEAHGQLGHPAGQDPLSGVTHMGFAVGPPGTTQQIVPALQHWVPQQLDWGVHVVPGVQRAVPQRPLSQ